ncbi:MAG: glycosyltransferase family 4 protein [bacterium]|nr:glycosyltransferase family 4 protein [bacterium]
MKRRLLVLSTVHPADDPRIRRKLIGTLQEEWTVTFAGRGRGPIDQTDLDWCELSGGRVGRWLRAARLLLGKSYDVASLHDPELIPLGILASIRRRTVVFDVHENIPAQLRTKEWVPRPLRRPLAAIVGWLLRVAERRLAITLAESGYSSLFREPHPVFPNYLVGAPPPPRPADPDIGIVYLGDVTEARGLAMVVEAAGRAGGGTLTIMGRCTPEFRARLLAVAASHGLSLEFHGFVTPARALEIAAGATVAVSPLLDTPNYRGSLPTKVLEYLAVGVPTLASDLEGTRAVVAGKPGLILVPPGNVEAWTAAISDALADQELRSVARGGVAAIQDGYVWPEDEVRTFYRELVD